jgi:hypothetical protein
LPAAETYRARRRSISNPASERRVEKMHKIIGSLLVSLSVVALASGADAQSLQQQAICAAQAKKIFEAIKNSRLVSPTLPDVQSHYSTKTNRCLVLETDPSDLPGKGGIWTVNVVLFDAFERRTYAKYFSSCYSVRSRSGMECLSREDAQFTCDIFPAYGQAKPCKSYAEFAAFVSDYMDER